MSIETLNGNVEYVNVDLNMSEELFNCEQYPNLAGIQVNFVIVPCPFREED